MNPQYTEPYNRRRQTPRHIIRGNGEYLAYDFSRFPYLVQALQGLPHDTREFYVPVYNSISPLDEYDVSPTSPMLALLYRKYAPGFVPKLFVRARQMFHSNNPLVDHTLLFEGPEHHVWGPRINPTASAVVTVPDCFQPALERAFMQNLLQYLRTVNKPFIDTPINFLAHVNITRVKDFADLFGVDHEALLSFMDEAEVHFPSLSHVLNIGYEPRYGKYVLYYGNTKYFEYYHLNDTSLQFPYANRYLESALPSIDFVFPPKPRIPSLQRS